MGRGWWRIALVALLCCAGVVAGGDGRGAEAAPRPTITWTYDPPVLPIDTCPKAAYGERDNYFSVDICPGQEVEVAGTFTPSQDVTVPRLVLQTPSGARILTLKYGSLGSVIRGGTTVPFSLSVKPPPGYRNVKASGRIYVADRGSVLVPPLFVQVTVLHPTPEERALTPVVIPTNHLRILPTRFNLTQFSVVSGTNVTFTNMDTRDHAVFGKLCTIPTGLTCAPIDVDPGPHCNTPDPDDGVIPCIDSGPLIPHGTFNLRLTRPSKSIPVRYELDDRLAPLSACKTRADGPNPQRHLCYLTVK
jgi:hypothetical protein